MDATVPPHTVRQSTRSTNSAWDSETRDIRFVDELQPPHLPLPAISTASHAERLSIKAARVRHAYEVDDDSDSESEMAAVEALLWDAEDAIDSVALDIGFDQGTFGSSSELASGIVLPNSPTTSPHESRRLRARALGTSLRIVCNARKRLVLLIILAALILFGRMTPLIIEPIFNPIFALPVTKWICGGRLPSRHTTSNPDFPRLSALHAKLRDMVLDSANDPGIALRLKDQELAVDDLSAVVNGNLFPLKEELAARLKTVRLRLNTVSDVLQSYPRNMLTFVNVVTIQDSRAHSLLEGAFNPERKPQSGASRPNPYSSADDLSTQERSKTALLNDLWSTNLKWTESMLGSMAELTAATLAPVEKITSDLKLIDDMIVLERTASRDDARLTKEATLATLWTSLNGNHKSWMKFESTRQLLLDVPTLCELIRQRLALTLASLRQLKSDITDLRNTGSTSSDIIPFEMQIRSLKEVVDYLSPLTERVSTIGSDSQERYLSGQQLNIGST